MVLRSGSSVTDQFIIVDAEFNGQVGSFFQADGFVIAFKSANGSSITLDRNKWDYSVTTGKYRNQFLGETKKETEKKITSGEYILADLN